MYNAFYLLFRAPWWLFVGLAALAFWGGDFIYKDMKAEKEARLAALQAPVPPVVDLSDFSKRDIPVSDEVHLKGWINLALNHRLAVTKKGRVTRERHVFVLFGSEDGPDSKTARAALFFTSQGREQFLEQLDQYMTGFDAGRPMFQVNGFGGEYESFEEQLEDALAEKGVTLGPDFIAIHPFLDGREAGLSLGGDPEQFQGFSRNAAIVLFLIAGVKFLTARNRRKSRDDFSDSPITSGVSGKGMSGHGIASVMPHATGTTTGAEMPKSIARSRGFAAPRADTITDDSPLGRMHKRDQALRGLAASADQPVQDGAPSFDFSQKPALPSSGLWEKFKKSAAFVLAAAFLLIWVGRKSRLLELEDAGDIMRWVVTGIIILCLGFGGWFLMTRDDFAGGHPMAKIAIGLGGLFLLVQVQGFLGAPAGGALLFVVILLSAPILLWSFVISRFVKGVKSGVDKAAAAAVKAKMRTDPFEKLTRENLGPVQSSR